MSEHVCKAWMMGVFSCLESDLLLAVTTGAVFRVQGIWSTAR
jgi:hypothetical protein